ncbi:uncharacterized protein FIBRA_04600 [Fibroporia radiculosa]|uniref:Uncharacterized protein n=1 Tax=Fibroporia radiculosa TaxID=599839 RepID=J4G7M5_9APHY|nr:uncharacterized protein FIBRA_04600 [Fibroporia radiculosa]CCM02498.1 predicted protein [Fibroporia radiculosa]
MPLTLTFLCNDPLNTIIVNQSSGQTNHRYEVTSIELDDGKRRTTLTALTPIRRVIGNIEWKGPLISGLLTATVKGRRITTSLPPRGCLNRIMFMLCFMGRRHFKWKASDGGKFVLVDCSNGSVIARYWSTTSALSEKEQISTLELGDKGFPSLNLILFTFVWAYIKWQHHTAFRVKNMNMN